jgi:hypothetical protein
VISFGKDHGRLSVRKVHDQEAFISRLLMALFGGIALILPTIIMAKHPSTNFSLGTTAVATVLFALALAFGAKNSTGKDVLAATAAYSAILVVFIRTSRLSPSSPTPAINA